MLARTTVEAIDTLLSRLRDEEKWTIAPDQVVRTHTVMLELLEDPDIATPADLAPWIAPIICASPAEQRDFHDRMANLTVKPAPVIRPPRPSPVQPARQTRRILLILAAALLLIAAAFGAYAVYVLRRMPDLPVHATPKKTMSTQAVQDNAPVEGGEPFMRIDGKPAVTAAPPSTLLYFGAAADRQLAAALIGMLALLSAAAIVLWRVRRQYELTKAFEREGDVDHHYPRVGTALFLPADFRRIGQLMLRRRYEPSEVIDVPRSVRATTRNGGYFTAIYGTRGHFPEYVALIDRATVNDQQALLYEEYVMQLRNADVPVDVYEFRRDPRICWRKGKRRDSTSFTELARVHSDHVLLLFSDAATFIDPVRGELAYWTESFQKAFRAIAVFTSRPPAHWDEREQLVARESIAVFPASGAGIAAFAATLNATETVPLEWADTLPSLPPILTYQPSRWVANTRPSDSLVAQLLRDLEATLGSDGLRWLAAAAVYPGIDWYVTLYLAAALRVENVERNLLALVRLPWFRRGSMPDWLRTELIWNMSRKEETETRTALKHLFVSSMKAKEGVSALHIVTFRDIRNAAPENSPLRDYVLARFMDGARPRPLDLKLPSIWESIRKSLSSGDGRRDPLLPLIAAYLPLFSLWPAYGKQSAEVRWHGRNGTALTVLGVVWAVLVSIGAVALLKLNYVASAAVWIGSLTYASTFLPLPALAFYRARRGERLRLPMIATFADGRRPKTVIASPFRRPLLRIVYYLGPVGFFFWRSRHRDLQWHARNGAMLSVVAGVAGAIILPFSGPIVTYGFIGVYAITVVVGAEFAVRGRYLQLPLVSVATDHVPPEDQANAAPAADLRRVIAIVAAIVAVNFMAIRAGADPAVLLATSEIGTWFGALVIAVLNDLARTRRLGMFLCLVAVFIGLLLEDTTVPALAALIFFGNGVIVARAFTRDPAPRLFEPANIYAIAQVPRLINAAFAGREVPTGLTGATICVCLAFGLYVFRLPYNSREHEHRDADSGNAFFGAAVVSAICAASFTAFSVNSYLYLKYGMKSPAPVGMLALAFAIVVCFTMRRIGLRLAIALGTMTLTVPVLVAIIFINTTSAYAGDVIHWAREIVSFLILSAVVASAARYSPRFLPSALIAIHAAGALTNAWSQTFSLTGGATMVVIGAGICAIGSVVWFFVPHQESGVAGRA